jgi:multidrug transporter EmrE-like cation transporter
MRGLWIGALVIGYSALNTLANTSYKFSSASPTWKTFVKWQVLGNLSGFISVLAFTGLLRWVPLHIAYPVTQGLAMLGVQVIAAWLLFREGIGPLQWAGTLLVVVGIALISAGRSDR